MKIQIMQAAKESLQLSVNGKKHTTEVDPDTPLLYVLRNQLALNGPKYGCGLGQCGSCMVLLDQQAVLSCLLPVRAVADQEITTLKGLVQNDDSLHPVQQAFVDEQAAQCGYCTNGMIMATVALLHHTPQPDEQAIRDGLQLNLCRCGSQSRVIRGVQRAAQQM